MGEEVDNRSNKYSFSSSFPIDNSMFPVWCELLTVLSNSNEIGAAIHLQIQMSQTLKINCENTRNIYLNPWGWGAPPKVFHGGCMAQTLKPLSY